LQLQSKLADLQKHIFVVHFFEELHFLNPCPPTEQSYFTTSLTLIAYIGVLPIGVGKCQHLS
jgi:hypothetical protein